MRRRSTITALAGGLLVLASALSPAALAQDAEGAFYRGYYLQHEAGDLEGAMKSYRQALEQPGLDAALRERARDELRSIHEDLATRDFARLMPRESILYVELNRPGAQVSALLDQLGLLGDGGHEAAFGVSPLLLEGVLGMRGAALAITEIDPNGGPPEGVLVLHPGDREALRGLLETGLPSAGVPVESIAGNPTWMFEQQAFVTMTPRLMVAGTSPQLVEGVLDRMAGGGADSLAHSAGFEKVASLRGDDLLFFHVNAEPVLPMLRYALEQEARHDPEAAMGLAFVDVDSLRGLSGRVGVGADGIGLDVALTLADGHRNLLFNLMRTPAVGAETLALVPEGAAFFFATSLNEAAPVAPVGGTPERPIVTAMDFGREVFANLVDVVVYGLPPEAGASQGAALPEVVACLRVNDASRSKALWNFVLGLASQSSGARSMEPKRIQISGVAAEQYELNGVPVYLVTNDHELLISPSRSAIVRTLEARKQRRSVAGDPLYASCLEALPHSSTTALVLSPGRCAAMALPFAPRSEAEQLRMASQLLHETVLCVGLEQSDTRLAVSARLGNLPDVSPIVAQAIRQQRGQAQPRATAVRALDAPAPTVTSSHPGADVLRQTFEQLAASEPTHQAARELGSALVQQLADQPIELNDFAWALLTEEPFQGHFTELAREASLRSNELTGHRNWALLDTLALAEFELGHLERAIELERKALEFAEGTGREAEVREALERFLEAKRQPETVSAH